MAPMNTSQKGQAPMTNLRFTVNLLPLLRSRKWLLVQVSLWLACLLALWHLTPVTPRAALWGEIVPHLHAFSLDGNTLVTTAGPSQSSANPGPIHL
jgi:hypothetical protein